MDMSSPFVLDHGVKYLMLRKYDQIYVLELEVELAEENQI
jgi:hypothetical protein